MTAKIIESFCEMYSINPRYIEELRNEERYLAKIETEDGNFFYVKGEEADSAHWEASCDYAWFLYKNGFHVPQYLKSSEGKYVVQIEDRVFSVERALEGIPIEQVNDDILTKMGRLLGLQHKASMNNPSSFHQATSWSLFGGNKTDAIGDYDENELSFLDFKGAFENHRYYQDIENRYTEYRSKLKEVWHQLPQGAVQGDFCHYNMLLREDHELAFYDFNLAGNEVFLNECIAVAVYHSWHVPYEGSRSGSERFQLFLDAYQTTRPMTELEIKYLPDLTAIIRAFRFDRVEDGIALKNERQQDHFLEETLTILLNRDIRLCAGKI